MDKPILFFDNPKFVFSDKHVEYLYKSAASCFSDSLHLAEKIQTLLTGCDPHREERKIFVNYFLANQGHAAKYIVDTIENLGRVSGPLSRSWKRILDIDRK